MADSENSRTLPAITCRNPLQTTERFLARNIADQERWIPGIRDVFISWNASMLAFRGLGHRGSEKQELKSKLCTMVPTIRVEIQLPDHGGEAVASINQLQNRIRGGSFLDVRANAAVELLSKRQRWGSADVSVAYSRAKRAGSEGSIAEERFGRAVGSTGYVDRSRFCETASYPQARSAAIS